MTSINCTSIFGEGQQKRGVLLRATEYLFRAISARKNSKKKFRLGVSFMEIYCGHIRDLGLTYVDKIGGSAQNKLNTADWYIQHVKAPRLSRYARRISLL